MQPHMFQLLSAALFAAVMLSATLFALSAAGHFPSRDRLEPLRTGLGPLILWGTMLASGAAVLAAVMAAWRTAPWPYVVVAGSLAILFAPLVLQRFPDRFVDSRRALLAFATVSAGLAAISWQLTG